MQEKKILVIDDDAKLRRLVGDAFSKSGAKVYTAADGPEGLRQFYDHRPDLVILDIMLPGMDGWQVCSRIRNLADVPIILLTALSEEDYVVQGFECGAIDYVTKPFSLRVLLARAEAALRQAAQPAIAEKPVTSNDNYLVLDPDQRRVLVRGKPVTLSPTEYRLLAYLLQNAGRVLTYQEILAHVWGREYHDSTDYVHTYISHLRRKLEANPKRPRYMLTEHGVGYRFEK